MKRIRIRKKLAENWQRIVLGKSFYVHEIINTKVIKMNHNYPLIGQFDIENTWELIIWKYPWLMLQANIEA